MKTTTFLSSRRNPNVPGIHSRLLKYYLMLGGILVFVASIAMTNP